MVAQTELVRWVWRAFGQRKTHFGVRYDDLAQAAPLLQAGYFEPYTGDDAPNGQRVFTLTRRGQQWAKYAPYGSAYAYRKAKKAEKKRLAELHAERLKRAEADKVAAEKAAQRQEFKDKHMAKWRSMGIPEGIVRLQWTWERMAMVLRLRQAKVTLRAVAAHLDLSVERVRQIEKKAERLKGRASPIEQWLDPKEAARDFIEEARDVDHIYMGWIPPNVVYYSRPYVGQISGF